MDEVDGRGIALLHCAAQAGSPEVIRALVSKYKADINVKIPSLGPLSDAGRNAYLMSQFGADLATQGFPPEVQSIGGIEGKTPLHVAAMQGRVDNIKALVELGADIGATDDLQMTPLFSAALLGYYDAVCIHTNQEVLLMSRVGVCAY